MALRSCAVVGRWELINQRIHLSSELCQDARKSAHHRARAGHVPHTEGFLRPFCILDQHLRIADQIVQPIYLVGHGGSLPVGRNESVSGIGVGPRRPSRDRAAGAEV